MIQISGCTPPQVADAIRELERDGLSEWTRLFLERIATDPRMETVYAELLKRDRKTGRYCHQTVHLAADADREKAHFAAVVEFIVNAFNCGVSQQKTATSAEIEEEQQKVREIAATSHAAARDAETWADHGIFVQGDDQKRALREQASAVRAFAGYYDFLADHHRPNDSPLVSAKPQGDRLVKGVQIQIAKKALELFGSPLHGTSATLTAVVLGLDEAPSTKPSRSAFSAAFPQ